MNHYTIEETQAFHDWMHNLRDLVVRARIRQRLIRLQKGNFGDYKSVGEGVFELRFTFGAGYRIYFIQQGHELIIVLAGGDKSTQTRDIQKAIAMAHEYRRPQCH